MKSTITILLLWLSLSCFGQSSTTANFSLTIKFDKLINVDSLEVSFYEKSGQRFNSINYSTDKSNNTVTIWGENDYIIGTKFPTLVFSYKTLETKMYQCIAPNNKNIRLPCKEIVECKHLFHLITGHHIGSYNDKIPTEIKFSLKEPNILITKAWVADNAEAGGTKAKYTITTATDEQLSYKPEFFEQLSISSRLIKINKQ